MGGEGRTLLPSKSYDGHLKGPGDQETCRTLPLPFILRHKMHLHLKLLLTTRYSLTLRIWNIFSLLLVLGLVKFWVSFRICFGSQIGSKLFANKNNDFWYLLFGLHSGLHNT